MITPLLERLLITGEASYVTHSHAFGMFGRIPSQPGKIAIIEKIIWYPFLNPINNSNAPSGLTWRNFFRYCEYQLKIDGEKTVNFYHFKNALRVEKTMAADLNLSATMAAADFDKMLLQPCDPVVLDTFLVCGKYIKLTISRSSYVPSVNTMAALSPIAGEKPVPNGVGAITNVLERVQMLTPNTATQVYNPPSNNYSGLASAGVRQRESYTQDFATTSGGADINYNSTLSPPIDASGTVLPAAYQFLTHPLITFGIVYINEQIASQLQSTA